jgi:hypothetical protein
MIAVYRASLCFALLAVAAAPTWADDQPLKGLARWVSPEFRRLDDRRAELRAGELRFPPQPTSFPHFGFHSNSVRASDQAQWLSVDLGESRPLDAVVLVPAPSSPGEVAAYYFPIRFRVDLANRSDFADALTIADHTAADFTPQGDRRLSFPPIVNRLVSFGLP